VRAALFMAALALGAGGCGKKKDKAEGKANAARCAPAALTAVRSQLAAVPADRPVNFSPPRVMSADGAGRTAGAVRLTYVRDRTGEVRAQVGDQAAVVAGEVGSSQTLLQQLQAALTAAPAKLVELETIADLSPIALQPILTGLDPSVELRLVVDQVKPPPTTGVAPWAIKMYDGLSALPSEARAGEIQKGLVRALRGRCFTTLDQMLAAQGGALDDAAARNALPEALTSCGCQDADVTTATWLYQLMVLRTYEPAWLRLRLDTGGARLSGVRTMQDVARGLAALTPEQRQKGVWIVP
jgi:hypothetical protein